MQLKEKMYKIIWCFIFFSYLISNTKAQEVSRAVVTCDPNDSGVKCRDTNTLIYCLGGHQLSTISCSQQSPNRPFCNFENNTCVESLSSCSLNKFICPGPGLFLNPDNCHSYYYCEEFGSFAEIRSCLDNKVFDFSSRLCVSGPPCVNLTEVCNGSYKILPYDLHIIWYIACQGQEQPIILSCPQYHRFNRTSLSCEFECPHETFLRNPINPQNYYICVLKDNEMVYVENSCEDGEKFYGYYGVCSSEYLEPDGIILEMYPP